MEFPRLVYYADKQDHKRVESQEDYDDAIKAGFLSDPPLEHWYPHVAPKADDVDESKGKSKGKK